MAGSSRGIEQEVSMQYFRYGGKKGTRHRLSVSNELLVVRTHSLNSVMKATPFAMAPVSAEARGLLSEYEVEARFPEAGVEVYRSRTPRRAKSLRDRARSLLKQEPGIRFAGRALCDPVSRAVVVYTENLFVKFDPETGVRTCRKLLKEHGLTVKQELEYAPNAYFVGAPEGTGLVVFELAEKLLGEKTVELCHPELVRQVRGRAAAAEQWHLKKTTVNGTVIDAHSDVESAWALTEGAGVIIAVIDDGVDLDHQEFRSSFKIVAPRDVSRRTNDPRPGSRDHHGTACAGVACADGRFRASGVAPQARLMPIRMVSGLGSQAEADSFVWAAQNGADIISCSWGPVDGPWWDPNHPLHQQAVPLPDSTRLAIDYAIQHGRNGKGCVIVWAAGNGNESVDLDGYASYDKVIAVAACNDQSRRSAYSDFGKAVWCAFPSSHGTPSLTPGIWTTDRSGASGYNPGHPSAGDPAGHYTNSFGGTSSSTPGVAGVAALMLARNPELRWDQVKDILRNSCDRIDTSGGAYDETGHSVYYGYGRVNARKAVDNAKPVVAAVIRTHSATQDVPIRDLRTSRLSLEVADSQPATAVQVTVDIEHTYIGDLVVTIKPPAGSGAGVIRLHNREGGSNRNLKVTYDAVNAPGLAALEGQPLAGTWTLEVQDKARFDTGVLRGFTLHFHS